MCLSRVAYQTLGHFNFLTYTLYSSSFIQRASTRIVRNFCIIIRPRRNQNFSSLPAGYSDLDLQFKSTEIKIEGLDLYQRVSH
jgi:hypothetical protein